MLSEVEFDLIYASGEKEPADFFLKSLMNSCRFDLGLGYFNTSGFRALAIGFAYFIHKGGTMRFIINDTLSIIDKQTIEDGKLKKPGEIIESNLINSIKTLSKTLTSYETHFFKCISWLISTNKLQIKAYMPIGERRGIVHQKFGIFYDDSNNKIAFSGSANFSKSAFNYNLENITCHKSWVEEKSEIDRIRYFIDYFEKIWCGNNGSIIEIPIDKIKTTINSQYGDVEYNDLLNEEIDLVENSSLSSEEKYYYKKILNRIKKNIFIYDTPNYQCPKLPEGLKLYDFQLEAYKNWKESDFKGLFVMATGTGKTFAALNCALELYKINKYINIIILVPTIPLATQWKEDVEKFNFQNIILINSKEKNWDNEALRQINKSRNFKNSFVLISTYASYSLSNFQSIVSKLDDNTLIIADEVHNFGSGKLQKLFPEKFKNRLGLSATPKRYFDEAGTNKIFKYFNVENKITFEFNLKDAIDSNILCQYYYFPKIIFLLDEELNQYKQISIELYKYYDNKLKTFKKNKKVELLFIKRKRIIQKAFNKINALREILNELLNINKNLKFTLVYVPEGKINPYDSNGNPTYPDKDDLKLINEYSRIISKEFGLKQHQFIGLTKNRNDILQRFASGKISVLTAMKCLDEGINIARTENAIFCASTSNPRQYVQRRGRILRKHPDKKFAYIYDIIVVPDIIYIKDSDNYAMEKNILISELKRVVEFAGLAINKNQALKSIEKIINKFEIEIF